jgi:hypothetical protein
MDTTALYAIPCRARKKMRVPMLCDRSGASTETAAKDKNPI